ncbi:MAG: glucosamine-6-phosphate deaminase [Planctomycetales bacterium]|nr:glucosamine-6-phosphate deaminase [Planctomycetales bacterium]
MKIVIAPDRTTLGSFAAKQAAITLRRVLQAQPECNVVIATGSSQFEVLESLVQQPDVDWSRVNGFHLDEYLGIDKTHSASFCGYLAARFVDRLPLKSFYYLDGTLPPEQLRMSASVAISDRTIDLVMCGIGENGHLAFNDPPADFETQDPYLIVELDEACRKQQVGEGWFDSLASVPTQAISMSIHQILKASKIICSVPDRRKAEAVKASLEGEISPNMPASALRRHADVTLLLDSSSASLLDPSTMAGSTILDPQQTNQQA